MRKLKEKRTLTGLGLVVRECGRGVEKVDEEKRACCVASLLYSNGVYAAKMTEGQGTLSYAFAGVRQQHSFVVLAKNCSAVGGRVGDGRKGVEVEVE